MNVIPSHTSVDEAVSSVQVHVFLWKKMYRECITPVVSTPYVHVHVH